MKPPRIIVIDNYDSFTFNLVQILGGLGARIDVFTNDEITAARLRRMRFDGLLISPGPGRPEEAGVSLAAIRALEGRVPLLGVCLGHQSLAVAHGGRVGEARNILHGKTSQILHGGDGLFSGLSNPFTATRYHSLEIPRDGLPPHYRVVAWTTDDEIMGIRDLSGRTWGVQFHPESILTTEGHVLLQNFMTLCADASGRRARSSGP